MKIRKWSAAVLCHLAAVMSISGQSLRTEDPGDSAAAGPRSATFRIASYNTWGLPVKSEALRERWEKLPGALAGLKPDVICLQEVWTKPLRDKLVAALGPAWHATRGHRGGLLTLSRFPLAEESFEDLPKTEDLPVLERFSGKGFLTVVVTTPAGRFRAVNAHLSTRDHAKIQLRRLRERIGPQTDLPLIVAADVNAHPQDPAFREVLDAGFKDCMAARRPPDGTALEELPPTRLGWPRGPAAAGRSWRPDCLLYRSSNDASVDIIGFRQALDTPETALSDHNLQLGEFRLLRRNG